jgi:aryl-alcohol dehydrogenase-like predicted oxidoreductase
VYLPAIEQATSAVGFGCVGLTSVNGRREALDLLECAFEGGIRHFDVARAYGLGVAEEILGEFLKGRRNDVTITTKFGIVPPAYGQRIPFLPALKRALKRLPIADRMVRRRVSTGNAMGRFSPQAAKQSLEASLRALQTDYVDICLLHEANLHDARSAELISFLQEQRRVGRIRAFGVGGEFGRLEGDAANVPPQHQVLQFENSVHQRNARALEHKDGRTIITHSALKHASACIAKVPQMADFAPGFCKTTGIDLRDNASIAKLLLAWALYDNPGGVVLFGSTSTTNIRSNADVLTDARLSPEAIRAFERAVDEGLL